MSQIDSTLNERGQRYGDFDGHATITQALKAVMQDTPNWDALADDQKEALEMTAHKIGRILNGDPDYLDSWHDIIGYIRLVEQRLEQRQNSGADKTPVAQQAGHGIGKMIAAQQAAYEKRVADARTREQAAQLAELGRYGIHVMFIDEDSVET